MKLIADLFIQPAFLECLIMATKLNINGEIRDISADPDTPLLWVIRDELNLT